MILTATQVQLSKEGLTLLLSGVMITNNPVIDRIRTKAEMIAFWKNAVNDKELLESYIDLAKRK